VNDLAVARRLLEGWNPPTPDQARTRNRMLAFLAEHPRDAHLRSCLPGHLTASALVVDAKGERVLLTHHKKLRRWLQLGGHCDGDADLAAVALREATEESGIRGLEIEPVPIDLDIHTIPARPGEPEHLHLDTRFLVRAPEGATARASDESIELRWFGLQEALAADTDESVRRLVRLFRAETR
jgi:8-oxo-dGTP pyrophosphatase MutT (NUDIX family)